MPHSDEFINQLANAVVEKLTARGQLFVGPGAFTTRRVEFNGVGDTRLLIRDNNIPRALNLSMSHGSAGAGNASLGLEGLGVHLTINGTTNRIGFQQQTLGTGGATATLTANKPGANTGVSTWATLNFNGTDYYLPLWL